MKSERRRSGLPIDENQKTAETSDVASRKSASSQSATEPPPLPSIINPDTACAWLEEVIPRMDPRSRYRKNLMSIVQRHAFRKKRAQGAGET